VDNSESWSLKQLQIRLLSDGGCVDKWWITMWITMWITFLSILKQRLDLYIDIITLSQAALEACFPEGWLTYPPLIHHLSTTYPHFISV